MSGHDQKSSIAKAAGLMSVATFISRILGYVKDMILAGYFGATGMADTFFVAFRIPNLLREIFAEGSMSSAFIPVLTEYRTKHGEGEAKRLVRITFTFLLIFVGILCLVGVVISPVIVTVVAPGFFHMTEKFTSTVLLTRVMFPFLLFISLAALVMGALNTKRVFFIPSLAPAVLNVTIIVMVFTLAGRTDPPILAVAVGVALGGFVQFAFQLPSFFRNGYSLRPDLHFGHPGLKRMSVLMLPATLGMAVAQINIFVSTILASYLPEGSITYLYYSMRLIQFPIGMFGVAMGMAVLPSLSEHAVKGHLEKLSDDFSFSLRLLFFITVPAMTGLIALREPIVHVLFQRGAFDYAATVGTAQALLFYAMGIWSIVGVRIVTVGFYSLQDTKTPVKIAATALAANVLFSLLLMKPLSHSGLALANTLASYVNFLLLFLLFRKKLPSVDTKNLSVSFVKTLAASCIMGIAGWILLRGEAWNLQGEIVSKVSLLTVTIASCVIIYFFISYLIKSEECLYVLRSIKKRLGR